MRQTQLIMGMPVAVEIVDSDAAQEMFDKVFDYFRYIDNKFSTYKPDSEITLVNEGKVLSGDYSADMKTVFALSEQTKQETNGYFDIRRGNKYDPSGLVKGWAIHNAAKLLARASVTNFFIDAGGDVQVGGANKDGRPWAVGIRNPFQEKEIVKVVYVETEGVATSGTYIRGQHIYNPHKPGEAINDLASLTVIGPDIYEADRFATAAFAMGKAGINFIESLPDLEGYMIDQEGVATMTSKFERYTISRFAGQP